MNFPSAFVAVISALPLVISAAIPLPPELSAYVLERGPETTGPVLKMGDRLAICGDSITEQKQYSVMVETYLTACAPELEITCRQYGWGGEQAGGFLKRVKSDVLRFNPTVATIFYGMNDFRYVPYDEPIAAEYRKNQTALVRLFRENDCLVVLGSPGIIDTVPHWVKTAKGTREELNLALSRFRNITAEIAASEKVAFADLYQPMLVADLEAKKQFGPDFKIAGKDGVHPGWAGQLLMARSFLKGMGLDGDLGVLSHDESTGATTAASGHEVVSSAGGTITLRSTRLPFSPGPGPVDRDDSIRAGMALVPFDDDLNRFIFRIPSPAAGAYDITWGDETRRYTAEQVRAGVNLAKDFTNHPLVPAFKKIWDAVAAKQTYETRQIKTLVHGPEGAADLEATFDVTEKARARFVAALNEAKQPVKHVISIRAVEQRGQKRAVGG